MDGERLGRTTPLPPPGYAPDYVLRYVLCSHSVNGKMMYTPGMSTVI